jgi:hypothetical protein
VPGGGHAAILLLPQRLAHESMSFLSSSYHLVNI